MNDDDPILMTLIINNNNKNDQNMTLHDTEVKEKVIY